jgi:Zn-dependent protease
LRPRWSDVTNRLGARASTENGFGGSLIQQVALWILPILFAVILHEVAHGAVAYQLGDDTAKRAGRLTLNPLKHIDPIGTVLLPLFLIVTHAGFLFGWAKPVPVNFAALRHPKRDMVFVAAAGPATNLLIAIAAALSFHGLYAFAAQSSPHLVNHVLAPLAVAMQGAVLANVFLGVFNMIPIPPLDGGRVLTGLLPLPLARRFARVEPFGFAILLLLLVFHKVGTIVEQPVLMILRMLKVPF